jgi:hypothetical protein
MLAQNCPFPILALIKKWDPAAGAASSEILVPQLAQVPDAMLVLPWEKKQDKGGPLARAAPVGKGRAEWGGAPPVPAPCSGAARRPPVAEASSRLGGGWPAAAYSRKAKVHPAAQASSAAPASASATTTGWRAARAPGWPTCRCGTT